MSAGKLFGDFLVEKGLITSDILLQVLVDQMRNIPSIVEVVFEGALLPKDVQLEILRLQTLHQWSYQQACSHLGFWSDELVANISALTEKSRTPLGQLVLSKTNMKFTELTKALDEYLSQDVSPKSVGLTVSVSGQKISSSAHAVSVEVQETLIKRSKPNIGENLLTELLEVFDDERRTRMESQIQTLMDFIEKERPDTEISQQLRTIHSEFQAMWGAARFVRLDLTGALIHSLDLAVVKCLKASGPTIHVKATQLIEPCRAALNVVWRLRTYLSENRTEQGFLDSDDNQEPYVSALEGMDKLSADFDNISGVA